LYRDVTVYEETARRAKIICGDMDAIIGDFVSVNQWAASAATTARRRAQSYIDKEDRKRHLLEVVPDLTDRQVEYLSSSHETQDKMSLQYRSCAPGYTTTCLFQRVGARFNDDVY
jgi:predicted DNA binding protein